MAVDFNYWRLLSSLTTHEVAYILCGIDPHEAEYVIGRDTQDLDGLREQFAKQLRIVESGIDNRTLTVSDVHSANAGQEVVMTSFINWLRQRQQFELLRKLSTTKGAGYEDPLQDPGKQTVSVGERRYRACVEAGLTMPDTNYSHLPDGIVSIAEAEGVTKQAFSASIKRYLRSRGH